jgi:branched-chain amino acid transport system ATP-binding protein
MIRIESLDAGYGGGLVLRDVTVDIAPGAVTCIVGPNGAGKSTVLRVLSGLLAPRSGRVMLEGRSVGGSTPADMMGHGVVLVPQQKALFPRMSITENLLMGAYPIRRQRQVIKERLARVRELYPLVAERADDPAGLLSGGQRRLVEFARAMMLDPRVIMLDEPSIGLDPRSLDLVGASIRRLAAEGRTVVVVEQNVRFGLGLADDAIVMEGGRIAMHAPAADVLAAPEVAEIFLGGHAARAAEER